MVNQIITVTSTYDLLTLKADSGSLILTQATDYRLRQAFASAGLEDAFNALQARRQRIQQLKESSDLEISSLLRIAVVLYQHEHLEGMEDYLTLFKTEILDKELQLSPSQISQTLSAARVKAQASLSAVATDEEKRLIEEMPRRVAYEYSRLSLPERKACLAEHLAKGVEPSKRSVMKHKRVKNVLPTPQQQPLPQPQEVVDVVVAKPQFTDTLALWNEVKTNIKFLINHIQSKEDLESMRLVLGTKAIELIDQRLAELDQ